VRTPETLPDDIAALQAALLAEREKRLEEATRAARIEAELAVARNREYTTNCASRVGVVALGRLFFRSYITVSQLARLHRAKEGI
jgi:hypothetical protein